LTILVYIFTKFI